MDTDTVRKMIVESRPVNGETPTNHIHRIATDNGVSDAIVQAEYDRGYTPSPKSQAFRQNGWMIWR